MGKNSVDMLSGSIFKGFLAIFLPIMLMNVITQLTSIIDMTVLGMLADDNGVGAIGACTSLISLVTSVIVYIPVGSTVIIAKHIGADDQERVDRAVGTSILLSIVTGLGLATIGVIFAKPMLQAINCPESLLPQATTYFRLYFGGVPFLLIYNFSAAILRSIGDTKRPMYYMTACAVLKIGLNLFIVGVLKMTVEGVAIATIASWFISGLLCFRLVLKGNGKVKFKLKYFRFYGKELVKILYIGVPMGVQSLCTSFANVLITATVNAMGPEATKGMSIANQYDGLMYQIIHSPSLAVASYVSQNLAAKNFKRAKQSVRTACLIGVSFGLIMGTLMVVFSTPLCSLMTKDPVVIKYAQQKMHIISPTYFIRSISEVVSAALRALEKPIIPVVTTLIFMCVIRYPWIWYVCPLFPNNRTVLYSIWPIGWILDLSVQFIFYFTYMKRARKRIESELNSQTATA